MSTQTTIERCNADGRAALIGYLPAGYPDVDGSIAALRAMVAAGVDLVEIGLPYSDPVMDGPVIQQATQQALARGFRVRDLFRVVEAVAEVAPTLVMTYWNPVERRGVEEFAGALADAGGAGLITPDLIPDEADDWFVASDKHGLDRVFVVAPSSTDERIALTTKASRGFVYAASLMGVTGARTELSTAGSALVERVRAATTLPIGLGLGVSTGAQAAEVAGFADGVIVGSAFVRCLVDATDRAAGVDAVSALAAELATGVRESAAR
ncbi:MAG TPA: tryptophan synthase subunit alpha [Nocardioidaceae bacterium]|nr:tryptophan synthase subunit alpha [Nocardioidaceae bacterium]